MWCVTPFACVQTQKVELTFQQLLRSKQLVLLNSNCEVGAGDEIRTRDLLLGKLNFYRSRHASQFANLKRPCACLQALLSITCLQTPSRMVSYGVRSVHERTELVPDLGTRRAVTKDGRVQGRAECASKVVAMNAWVGLSY